MCYDDNHITIDGDTDLSFTEDVVMRYESYGWHVQVVEDVNHIESLTAAIEVARQEKDKPSLIKIRTVIGYGSSKEGTHGVHGAPLGATDLAHVKQTFSFDPQESFVVDETVKNYYLKNRERGSKLELEWNDTFLEYSKLHPELAADFQRRISGELPSDLLTKWNSSMPTYSYDETKQAATRNR